MRYRKTELLALLLAISMLGPFTACQKQDVKNVTENVQVEMDNEEETQTAKPATDSEKAAEVVSLSDISPVFSPYNLRGQSYVAIDEESVLKVVRLAMEDAKDFYLSIGAGNMKLDQNNNKISGDENFYADWMNEYFFLARAMSETSFMINYTASVNGRAANDLPQGIMQISPKSIKQTLMQYYQNIYGVNVNLDNMKVFPNSEDLDKIYYSKEAQANVLETIYNNIYLSICYDIYNTKNLGPNHQDYYAKFGGYDEEIRREVVAAMYLFGYGEIIQSLRDGTFREKYTNTQYVSNILKYQDKFQDKYQPNSASELGN